MSTFWDNIKAEVKEYPSKALDSTELTLDSIWDNIPEQSLTELSSDCVHHFTIPTGAREVIGQCKKCNGERWFKNYHEEVKFNKTTKPVEQIIAEKDMQKDGLIDLQGGLI